METHDSSPQTPDMLLAQGVQEHSAGNFRQAIEYRERAAHILGMRDARYPGIVGTIALAYDRIGDHDKAIESASVGYTMLYTQLKGMHITEAQKAVLAAERPTVELHYGIVLARATAKARLEGRSHDPKQFTMVNKLIHAAHMHQQEERAKVQPEGKPRLHQWDINLLRRRVGAIAMDPTAPKLPGLKLGVSAIAKGVLSESPRFVDGTSNISGPHEKQQRLRAKAKAVLGGVAATAQCILSLSGSAPAQRAITKIAASRAVF